MKVIILSNNSYKEKDAIITAISRSETITFLAKGIKDPKSKNSVLNNSLMVADIELMDGDFKFPILKSAKELFLPLQVHMSSSYLGSLLLINEMMTHFFLDEDKPKMFNALEAAVMALKKTGNWLMVLLLFIAQAMSVGGYQYEVNRCVLCGQKNRIVAFSFLDGGFICEKCADEETSKDLSKEQMILLRAIFNSKDYHLCESSFNKEDATILLRKMLAFCQDDFGYHLQNIRLILD